MKWLMLRINVSLVIGMVLIVESVVVSMMKLLLVMLVVFFEVSRRMISKVICCERFIGVLVVWVMKMVVIVKQIEVLFRLNEQLVGMISLIIDFWVFVFFILVIRCGSVDLDDEVLSIRKSFFLMYLINFYMEKLCIVVILFSMLKMKIRQVRQNVFIRLVN